MTILEQENNFIWIEQNQNKRTLKTNGLRKTVENNHAVVCLLWNMGANAHGTFVLNGIAH